MEKRKRSMGEERDGNEGTENGKRRLARWEEEVKGSSRDMTKLNDRERKRKGGGGKGKKRR